MDDPDSTLFEVKYWPESTFQTKIQHFRVQADDEDEAIEMTYEKIGDQIDGVLDVYQAEDES